MSWSLLLHRAISVSESLLSPSIVRVTAKGQAWVHSLYYYLKPCQHPWAVLLMGTILIFMAWAATEPLEAATELLLRAMSRSKALI